MNNSQKLIIVPDMHGRGFWREAVKEHPEALFVFLGDYLETGEMNSLTKK